MRGMHGCAVGIDVCVLLSAAVNLARPARSRASASKDMEIVEMAKRISFALISRISTRYYVGTSTKYGSADIAI